MENVDEQLITDESEVNMNDDEIIQLIADESEVNMNDDKIIQSVLRDFNNTLSLGEIEEPKENISFNTAYSELQTSLIVQRNSLI